MGLFWFFKESVTEEDGDFIFEDNKLDFWDDINFLKTISGPVNDEVLSVSSDLSKTFSVSLVVI